MIPYGHQQIDQKDINEVVKVLQSDWLTQGPAVSEFEKALADYCSAKYAVACMNSTSALHLAYMAAGLSAGDEVITTPNTFVATSNMILAVGAKPVFCDIRLDTYNINENKIEELIIDKTKAIVPVHFAGQPCEMEKIKEIAEKNNLLVVEDGCHALGAKYKGDKVGSCKYSDLAVFSFHPVKPITTGEGGAITTNNEEYYNRMLSLRSHGIHKDEKGKNVMTELGYNYRMTDIQAALGLSQLKKLDSFIEKRREVVKWYEEESKDAEDVILPIELPDNHSGWHLYVIRAKDAAKRDGLMQSLKENGIGVNFHYPAVYSQPYYRERGYEKIELKNTDIYQNSCVTLPCHVLLAQNEIKFIAQLIKKF